MAALTEDPYRHLELDSAATLAWEDEQNRHAAAALTGWPGFEKLSASLAHHVGIVFATAPRRYGDRWFRREGAGLVASAEPLGTGTTLLPPAGSGSLSWFYPSPDGRLVAIGVSDGIVETMRVLSVEDGSEPYDFRGWYTPVVGLGLMPRVAWMPDGSAFFHNASNEPNGRGGAARLWFQRLGEPWPEAAENLGFRERFAHAQVSSDGRYAAAVPAEWWRPFAARVRLVKDLAEGGDWRPFLSGSGYCYGFFKGDDYVAVSYDGHDRGRVVAIPVSSPERGETWRELVPERDGAMRWVEPMGTGLSDGLAVVDVVDGSWRITIHDAGGGQVDEVELEQPAAVGMSAAFFGQPSGEPLAAGDEDGLLFASASPVSPAAVRRYDRRASKTEVISPAPLGLDNVVARRMHTTSADGHEVGMTVVHRADADLSQPLPTAIYCYGGANICVPPTYVGPFAPIVEAGGAFVLPNLRGDGHGGAKVFHQGRRGEKQHTFDDLIAVGEHLRDTGFSAPDRLGLCGVSNSGIVVGATMMQRPDLWKAVAIMNSVADMERYALDPVTQVAVLEYGDPTIPEELEWLLGYSPYHHVVEGTAYPSVLIAFGTDDFFIRTWHSRKLAARLQACTTSGNPVLLRAWLGGQHGASLFGPPDRVAEWVGFLMREIGLSL